MNTPETMTVEEVVAPVAKRVSPLKGRTLTPEQKAERKAKADATFLAKAQALANNEVWEKPKRHSTATGERVSRKGITLTQEQKDARNLKAAATRQRKIQEAADALVAQRNQEQA